jgi:DNA sulfur modification protein DndD
MGAIIESISFKNFYNYYGNYKNNIYRFKRGINIINADNNMGKSKFYNGVLWIVQDQVYDADLKRLRSVDESYILMASGKAKNEEHKFTMGVKIVFYEQEIKYTVLKEVKFQKDNNTWNLLPSFNLLQTEDNKDISILDIKEKEKIVDKLIPEELKRYALLQGESLEELVDLSSKSGLASTIETLVGINTLINAYETSSNFVKRSSKDLADAEKAANAENQKVLELLQKKEGLEKRIENAQDCLEKYQHELEEAENTKQTLEAHLMNAKKREQYKSVMDKLEYQINEKKKKKDNLEKSITTEMFSDDYPWLLTGMGEYILDYSSSRIELVKQTVKRDWISEAIMLPKGSPDSQSLREMLEEGYCRVCGRSAKRDSEAWLHIKKVLERPTSKEENPRKNDFSDFFSNIQIETSPFVQNLEKVGEIIKNYRQDILDLDMQIKILEEEKEGAELEFINAGGINNKDDSSDSKTISDFTYAGRTIDQKTEDINKVKENISLWEREIKSIENKLTDKHSDENVNKHRHVNSMMKQLELLFKNTKERIFNEIIAALEKNANEKYKELTYGNLTSGGKLEFKKQTDGTVLVSIRDVNNNKITGLGTGFQRMKQLSIVMAIISSKIGNKQFDFPFISDAPFSEFGNNFINNFFIVAPKVFTQSIILIKELYDPRTENFLNNLGDQILEKMKKGDIPGTFYVNVIKEKADTANLVTDNKCYKL